MAKEYNQPFPKFTQIGIFSLKIYHLATLHPTDVGSVVCSTFLRTETTLQRQGQSIVLSALLFSKQAYTKGTLRTSTIEHIKFVV
jgi:hypothetical protein